MNDPRYGNLMFVSVTARQTGSQHALSLAQFEGRVSIAKGEDGTVLIKLKPSKPRRTRRRRGQQRPPRLEFKPLHMPGCFWLEMNCLSLPGMNLAKRE